eukprot:3442149-Rhodomonas_salina.1
MVLGIAILLGGMVLATAGTDAVVWCYQNKGNPIDKEQLKDKIEGAGPPPIPYPPTPPIPYPSTPPIPHPSAPPIPYPPTPPIPYPSAPPFSSSYYRLPVYGSSAPIYAACCAIDGGNRGALAGSVSAKVTHVVTTKGACESGGKPIAGETTLKQRQKRGKSLRHDLDTLDQNSLCFPTSRLSQTPLLSRSIPLLSRSYLTRCSFSGKRRGEEEAAGGAARVHRRLHLRRVPFP